MDGGRYKEFLDYFIWQFRNDDANKTRISKQIIDTHEISKIMMITARKKCSKVFPQNGI
jgi:hypothetical protein